MPWPPSPLHVQAQTLPSDPTSGPSHVELFVSWTCAKGGWEGEKKICCFLLLCFCWCLVADLKLVVCLDNVILFLKGVCNQVIRGIVRMKHFAVIFSSRCLRVLTDVFVVWRTQHSSNLNVCDWIYIYTPVWFITHMIGIHVDNPNVWSNGRDPLQKNLGGNCDISCPKLVVYLVLSCCFLFISTIFRLVNCLGPHAWKWLAGGGRSACRHSKCGLDITALWMSLVIKIWMRCNLIHKLWVHLAV